MTVVCPSAPRKAGTRLLSRSLLGIPYCTRTRGKLQQIPFYLLIKTKVVKKKKKGKPRNNVKICYEESTTAEVSCQEIKLYICLRYLKVCHLKKKTKNKTLRINEDRCS